MEVEHIINHNDMPQNDMLKKIYKYSKNIETREFFEELLIKTSATVTEEQIISILERSYRLNDNSMKIKFKEGVEVLKILNEIFRKSKNDVFENTDLTLFVASVLNQYINFIKTIENSLKN